MLICSIDLLPAGGDLVSLFAVAEKEAGISFVVRPVSMETQLELVIVEARGIYLE